MESNTHLVKIVLKDTFGLLAIIAGLDKFTNILSDWSQYLPAFLSEVFFIASPVLMVIIGIIEIAAGILVFFKPKVGAYVVMSWLLLIAVTLISDGKFLDVAVRDIVMAIGAFSLAKLHEGK